MKVLLVALATLISFVALVSSTFHQEGYCAMYDNCGKRTFFGSSLPCPNNIKAVKPSEKSIKLLNRICGEDFPTDKVCCSEDQLINLESNLKKVDPLISSCPACRKNFYDFFCKFTCSSDQSTFVNISRTSTSIDSKKEIVTELAQFVDPEYANEFFQSCKEIKFSATNGYAMDLIGGGASNFKEFLKFLGDEKPLLGGSPFQINFNYSLSKEQAEQGVLLRSGVIKSCDDVEYKCSCSDCSKSCPTLPEFKDFKDRCRVGNLSCFSFSIIIIWSCLILILGGYHIYLVRSKSSISEDNDLDVVMSPLSYVTIKKPLSGYHEDLISTIQLIFARIGYFCASFPATTIVVSLLLTIGLSCGLFWLDLETNPVNLWVSPNEPALKDLQFFESNFGEWYRIEQIIISSKDDKPILNWENIKWWFEKELELQELNGTSLSDLCFKPLGETCAIESFTQYFHGNIDYLNEKNWRQQLKSCTDSPVNCLPSFQQPLKKNLLFDNENIFEAKAFVITLLIENNSTDPEYNNKVIEYEHSLREWVFSLKENTDLNIDFSTEISLTEELNKSTNTDIKIIIISYLFMFLYASLALGGKIPTNFKTLINTRFQLGLSGIIIILLSVTSSVGVFSIIGLKSTLIIAEVIPFLILAIGIDNIFLIVHELHLINQVIPHESVELRISKALSNIGPSCLISAILQVSMFLLAARVDMPAVKNFAYYSAGAVFMNFILQMTGFISLLAIDQKRLEDGRLDCFPWIRTNKSIRLSGDEQQDDAEHVEYDFSKFIGKYYAPFILSKVNSKKILSLFILWLGVSLSVLPRIEFGLDQRIAIPQDSYLIDYFNSVYKYLNVGPPIFFVLKDLNLTERPNQQKVCGKFSTCNEFSIANILEQEFKRSDKSTVAEPTSNWLDDFLTWLNPNLDQCCRFKKNSPLDGREFCSPNAPERLCETCYLNHDPPYSTTMDGFPVGEEFMFFFNQWIQEPSDPCPLGGKAPYSNSISFTNESIKASYFRTSHIPLRSQEDFINAYKNSLRIVREIEKYDSELDIFAFSPFYIFFVQYETIITLTFTLLSLAAVIIWVISVILLGSVRCATILVLTVASILINIAGILVLWSISLNAITLVNLIICVGLAVEFTVHITRAYTISSVFLFDENEDNLFNSFMNSNNELNENVRVTKAYNALTTVGGSVLGGITLTKIIGISVLAFTRSKIFEVYYFRMWASLIFIAAAHALCLLPILLSMFGSVKHDIELIDDEQFSAGAEQIDNQRRYGNDSDEE